MAKRKAKAVKVEAVKAWGDEFLGKLLRFARPSKTRRDLIRIRIIRESDYRRLLKAAKGK